MRDQNYQSLLLVPIGIIGLWIYNFWSTLKGIEILIFDITGLISLVFAIMFFTFHFSAWGKANKKRLQQLEEIPGELLRLSNSSIFVGKECDLDAKIFLPDEIRTRHVHILGSTGSGKTESVILNFLKQDVERGLGSLILDAKGDISFLKELESWVPQSKLRVFDLSDEKSLGYDPLATGSPLESAQRLFSSLTWSEEYYKSKALSALQRIFGNFFDLNDRNPTLRDVDEILTTQSSYAAFITQDGFESISARDFQDLSGLRDQVKTLVTGHLETILSPVSSDQINLSGIDRGQIIYFRLQSLMSPQIVSNLGKLLINHLNFLAGSAHRERTSNGKAKQRKLVPVYLDEFATFACPEFADLISKARSAGFALHFSHQSIGDVLEISKGFLNRIIDNAATKIILRINDPESAEYMSRCFGTREYLKATQRVTNAQDIESAEVLGEGTIRDAHQFRISPNLLKTLPTGVGAILVAHGKDTPHGASTAFKVRFPELKKSF